MSFFKNSNPIPKRENRVVTGTSCSVVTITVFTTPIRLGEEGGGGGGGGCKNAHAIFKPFQRT